MRWLALAGLVGCAPASGELAIPEEEIPEVGLGAPGVIPGASSESVSGKYALIDLNIDPGSDWVWQPGEELWVVGGVVNLDVEEGVHYAGIDVETTVEAEMTEGYNGADLYVLMERSSYQKLWKFRRPADASETGTAELRFRAYGNHGADWSELVEEKVLVVDLD